MRLVLRPQAAEDQLEAALDAALEAGYRHIDTATVYMNEHVIGKVLTRWLQAGKVRREDLFITTKVTIGFGHFKYFFPIFFFFGWKMYLSDDP